MTGTWVAALFAIGVGGWIYTKLARQTGRGNEKSAYIGALVAALVVFLFFFTFFKYILPLG